LIFTGADEENNFKEGKAMKYFYFFVLIINFTYAQYVPQSPYLQDPSLAIPYVDSCAQFWTQVYDPDNGGFYTNVDQFGEVKISWGTNKDLITQSRDAYGFVRAYMLTGNQNYLTMARHALDFMYEHAWDNTNDGWYHSMDEYGNPINPTDDKTAFDQHYALLGIAAYYEATGDTLDWNHLMEGYTSSETHLWDTDALAFGYFDAGTYNWSNVYNKSFNATVDAITTNVLALYLMTGDNTYRERLIQLADNILDHMYASMPDQAIGFVEKYFSDWSWDNTETMTIMGHVLKSGWCLGRIDQLLPDTAYVNAAKELIEDVWDKGYDHELGGPYKDYNRITGEMLMWGQVDTAKAWWQMEQAVTAGLMMYDLTGDDKYLQMADETLSFFMTYFVDHQYGEVYSDRTRYGDQIWGLEKGSSSKAGYHSIELGYYTYLYGNLFFKGNPVTLYYMFMPLDSDREIRMNPLAFADSKYKIKEVKKDGSSYSDFTADTRMLHLPAGTGGEFQVTYELTNPVYVTNEKPETPDFHLSQNYPNPFNPSTTISFTIPERSNVSLKVYDILGKEISVLVNGEKSPGVYNISFDGSSLASGVYIYRLESISGQDGGNLIQTRKMLLLK
jgi:mannose/cellobiose epimerase-like protein (N-acyl-D-glucosamine 2-epimerase family)